MAESLDLARDCLDNRLIGRGGVPIGRVDGIVMAIEGDAPPRLVAVEVGAVVLARRLNGRVARIVQALARRRGRQRPDPFRIPWSRVAFHGRDCHVDLDADTVPTRAWERLAARIVRRIPGGA